MSATSADAAATGERIRALLEQHGITVADFARDLGVHERTAYRWLAGDGPTPAMLREVAAYLEVPLVELIGREQTTLDERLAALEDRVDELLERLDRLERRRP